MTTNPILAELATAQQDNNIFAFSLGEESRQVARLRAIHAKKCLELEALDSLFEETKPDFVLRGADGSEVVLRIPVTETGEAYAVLRQALETGLRKLEEEIVQFLLTAQQDAELVKRRPNHKTDLRSAILDLCQPSAPSPDTLETGPNVGISTIQKVQARTNSALTAAA